MKTNPSNNDEHELSKRQFELWAKQLTEQFCKGVELGRTEGIKQGYAKALADVEKIIDKKIDHYEPYRPITDCSEAQEVRKVLAELKQSLASLGKEKKT